jgi:uroporphyrinogen decarboxylase
LAVAIQKENTLNKIERVASALKGGEVDRPPFSFWYHFGLQHLPGRRHAEAEIDFYRAYDLDFLKVMSDYPYPLPEGLEAVATDEDWRRIEPISPENKCWGEQLSALSIINDEIGKEALFIETIFSTWTTARRLARSGSLAAARQRNPEALISAMYAISTSLAGYAKQALMRGAAGIFLSLGAATDEVMSAEEYEIWGRPFDLKILEAVRDAAFNVLHIHGKRIHFNSLLDYPISALNWSHYATAPSLKEGKIRSEKTVLGGINEASASHVSAPEISEQVRLTIRDVGTRGLIVTPGCSVATDTRERSLREIWFAVEGIRESAR